MIVVPIRLEDHADGLFEVVDSSHHRLACERFGEYHPKMKCGGERGLLVSETKNFRLPR